ncbi:MAG: Fructose-2,6-bisphosphatase [Candidatus Woesebacteria bacterium GW2011_GWB1_43_14]|uniref:Fructose-2,6-bisphosphatase n=1 Tax=Candidatus Woesebacteria bacterium GW2011_GWB1_43_14 TaxID=1618578 RepID=A0A0G1FQ54_9BACT|nr:MAG: Fructose-2,6-bisphosphatase [Candidatus Woesebacteria bacterium GW2011_GWA1_39_11b]KKS78432.1 MAG: Fructose-2,6-bisphosphatase [Candidatus Woesebacteria bacterium GW2011_GWC1_42_9]KKS97151.1 MAG: Fructose-2,6-bisphosphatase [Candidatus Woesebacteria bacterium GW2011_GWB1_43_14]
MGRVFDEGIVRDDQLDKFRTRLVSLKNYCYLDTKTTKIISSPFRRCIETAEIAREELSLDAGIITSELLTETDMGRFSGEIAKDLRGEFGSLIDTWMHYPESFIFPGGESYSKVDERVIEFLRYLRDDYHGKNVVVCSHADVIKMMVSKVLNQPFNNRRYFIVPNGSISLLTLPRGGEYRLEGVNMWP